MTCVCFRSSVAIVMGVDIAWGIITITMTTITMDPIMNVAPGAMAVDAECNVLLLDTSPVILYSKTCEQRPPVMYCPNCHWCLLVCQGRDFLAVFPL